jgi:cephalosporin hydroxylase
MQQQQIQQIIGNFHQLYYYLGITKQGTWTHTYWMGVALEKCPLDLWIYQEIINEVKPELIIETGTRHGGSALYLSHLCDILGKGEVLTIDITKPDPAPQHPRLTYLTGSSTDPAIVEQARQRAQGKGPVMVILDSDHARDHVLGELNALGDLVTLGSYLIVEDTNVNGHPVYLEHGPGPMEALEKWMYGNERFAVDHSREKLLLTFNPSGYLKRIR